MRTMSNECEMKVMMVQRLDVRMKSTIEERLSVIVKARWEGGGWVSQLPIVGLEPGSRKRSNAI